MMLPNIYRMENVHRARQAVIFTIVGSSVLIAYLLVATAQDLSRMRRAETSLHAVELQSERLAHPSLDRGIRRQGSELSSGSVEALALRLSGWTTSRDIRLESFAPEGSPVESDVALHGASLGKWKARKVKARGSGEFGRVMALLNELRASRVPARLDSFSVQNAGPDGAVTFEFLITTYERMRETTP